MHHADGSRIFYWINHTGSYEGNSGVQRVTRLLARSLVERGRELTYVGWSSEKFALVRSGDDSVRNLSNFDGPAFISQTSAGAPVHLAREDKEQLRGSWLLVPEVTLQQHNLTRDLVDYCRAHDIKVAFVFYDLIPLLHPGYENIRKIHEVYAQQLALADLLIPISEYSAATLRKYFLETQKLPTSQIPQIATALLGETFVGARRPKIYPPPTTGTIEITVLGTVEARKNQTSVIRAFNQVCRKRPDLDLKLSIIGHVHPAVEKEFHTLVAANPKISHLGYRSDSELEEIYRRSSFSVFASVEEGYGLPIVESVWLGRPTICANFGSMAEVAAGGGCLTIDTSSEAAIAAAIESLATDKAKLRALFAEVESRRFKTWHEYAAEIELHMQNHSPIRRVMFWVDQTVAVPYNSGIQRVVRSFARAMQDNGVEVVFVKWDNAAENFVGLSPADVEHLAKWNGPSALPAADPSSLSRGDWLIVPELLVGASAPASKVIEAGRKCGLRVAFIVYDLLPLQLSEKIPNPREKPIYPASLADAFEAFWIQAAQADALVPISRATGDDILQYYYRSLPKLNNLAWRIVPTLLGSNFSTRSRSAVAVRTLKSNDVVEVLCVGTLEPRKNHLRLLRAFKKAASSPGAPRMRLTIVGSDRPYPDYTENVRQLIEDGIEARIISDADDSALAQLYDAADFVAYASYAEGFGLPVIESVWYGKPCICHNRGALAEVAAGGGVFTVDMLDEAAIAAAILRLASDNGFRNQFSREANARSVKSWSDYAQEVLGKLNNLYPRPESLLRSQKGFAHRSLEQLDRPLLSIAVTTYNRAEWLRHSLAGILRLTRPYRDVIEVLVCDNASTDHTPDVAKELREGDDFKYFRNPENVGMLGNLGVTAGHASGEFIWVIGDDDLLVPGIIENILEGILDHPESEMVYLNYAYTHFDNPKNLENSDAVIAAARPIAVGGPNRFVSKLREITPLNENFFTAIYACVFRRAHAQIAYNQDVSGKPFASLGACVPSTVYTMKRMLDLSSYWIGEPGVVVNMNVSWSKWALLWHLERMPELYDWVEREGMSGALVDKYRWNHACGAADHVRALYFSNEPEMSRDFKIETFIAQSIYLPHFREDVLPGVLKAYADAYAAKKTPNGALSPEAVTNLFALKLPN